MRYFPRCSSVNHRTSPFSTPRNLRQAEIGVGDCAGLSQDELKEAMRESAKLMREKKEREVAAAAEAEAAEERRIVAEAEAAEARAQAAETAVEIEVAETAAVEARAGM